MGHRRAQGTFLGGEEMFIILIMMSWVYTNVNTSQIVYFQYVQLTVFQSCPNKVIGKGLPSLSPLLACRSAEAAWALLTTVFPVPRTVSGMEQTLHLHLLAGQSVNAGSEGPDPTKFSEGP